MGRLFVFSRTLAGSGRTAYEWTRGRHKLEAGQTHGRDCAMFLRRLLLLLLLPPPPLQLTSMISAAACGDERCA